MSFGLSIFCLFIYIIVYLYNYLFIYYLLQPLLARHHAGVRLAPGGQAVQPAAHDGAGAGDCSGQVSCHWPRAGHVTTVATSDWCRCPHCSTASPHCDVYSLGLVLHELCSGES